MLQRFHRLLTRWCVQGGYRISQPFVKILYHVFAQLDSPNATINISNTLHYLILFFTYKSIHINFWTAQPNTSLYTLENKLQMQNGW